MRRLLLQRARTAAVHARPLARALGAEVPEAEIRVIRLAHGVDVDEEERQRRRGTARARLGLEPGAIVFGVFGGLSPEKRLPQVLRAFAALRGFEPSAVLLLAGERARHYDLDRDLDRAGVREATVATGYVDSDEALTDAICASDVALTLRWPSAGELSGPWLRCLGAGVPTVVTQLPQLVDVPWLDPRTWTGTAGLLYGESTPDTNAAPVCVAIDILDEDHSLLLAMRRLARDAALRERVGRAGRQRWRRHHALPLMVDDYHRAIAAALARPAPAAALPAHLLAAGDRTLAETVARFGLANPLR